MVSLDEMCVEIDAVVANDGVVVVFEGFLTGVWVRFSGFDFLSEFDDMFFLFEADDFLELGKCFFDCGVLVDFEEGFELSKLVFDFDAHRSLHV